MERNYFTILILLILPLFGLSTPIGEYSESIPPVKLYHDHSTISEVRNELNSKIINSDEDVKYRLPINTKPISYNIKLKTDVHVGKFEFTGTNEIKLEVVSKSNNITIHGRKINITQALLVDDAGSSVGLKPFPEFPAEKNEFLVFELATGDLVEKKIYTLTVTYNGTLRTDNGGFYLSKYQNKDQQDVYLATTQFESTDARHGFPCYDEPGIKAEVTIAITHGDNYTALSNMPIDKFEDGEKGYKISSFKTTKKMSPYLVAFIISNFSGKFEDSKSITHGVYSRPGTEDQRDFALKSSVNILNSIGDYVNYQYSFPKMDQVSIPDFAAGAMENWGLVTYREEMLLYHEKHSTLRTKTVIANTVAHEYGHQWFGNLVSPKWWSYLWLNEGFASLFAYIGADMAYPDWDLKEHFIVSEYQRALKADEGINKRPMTYDKVEEPKQIVGLFDSVSYSKAACVIQMIRHHIGEEAFKKSLNIYLKKMEYQSAEEADLFQALQDGAKEHNVKLNVTIEELMGSWTRQGGFPLLTVARDYENGNFIVSQEGFRNDGETGDDKRKWVIPFNFVTANNSNFDNTLTPYLLKDNDTKVEPNQKIAEGDWLLLNKQLTGYYRVNYDEQNWKLISNALQDDPKKIHKYNRAQLILDSYRLSLNKKVKIDTFFNLMEYLPKETEYSPWSSVDEALQFYKARFHDNEDVYKNLQFFILKNVEDIFEKLGVKDNSTDRHFDKYIRTIVVNWACTAGSEICLNTTNDRLKQLVENNTEIEPNLQSVIYCNGLRKSTDEQFQYMFDRLLNSGDQAERQLIMGSLGCAHDKKSLRKLADMSIDKNNNLRPQERVTVLRSVYGKNKEGFEVAVEFLIEKFNEYADITPGFGQTSPLDDAVKALSKLVVSEDQKKKMNELVEKVKNHGAVDKELTKKVEENVNSNLNWIKDNVEPVKNYLADFFKRKNSATQTVLSFMALMAVIIVSIKNAL